MNTLDRASSKWIGHPCCPECKSVSIRKRKEHYYCRHCRHSFAEPAKRQAGEKRRGAEAKATPAKNVAPPAYHRGYRWNIPERRI
jgi:ribosomal protein L37AE/L43A